MPYQGVPCFWLETTGRVRVTLRRFVFGLSAGEEPDARHRACAGQEPWSEGGYRPGCDASADLGLELPLRFRQTDHGPVLAPVPRRRQPLHRDPCWPSVCDHCGQPFRRRDEWQVNQAEVYTRSDTGAEVAFRGYGDVELAGALYDAWWLHGRVSRKDGVERRYVGPDGIALVAICPNGAAWMVDGPSGNGNGWTRVGDPRRPETLTASPSIVANDYHGFLQAGRFTDG